MAYFGSELSSFNDWKKSEGSSKIEIQIFAHFNWIKFQIAFDGFFCYFSNEIFVKMMEISPGNIDHFELKCRSLQEVKKYFSNGRIGLDVQKKYKFPTW